MYVLARQHRSVQLQTISDVNRFLAKIINLLYRDEIEQSKAGRLGYLSNLLISGLRDQDLEERVKKLEERFKNDITNQN